MAKDDWYLRHRDRIEHGPYSPADLAAAAAQGNITVETEVRHAVHTQNKWVKALRVRFVAEALPKPPKTTPSDEFRELESLGDQQRNTRLRRMSNRPTIPSTWLGAFAAIFDFRFRYFVTPYIIRVTWAIVVAVLAFQVTLSGLGTIALIVGELHDSDESAVIARPRIPQVDNIPSPVFAPSPVLEKLERFRLHVIIYVGTIVATILFGLWVRIGLEFTMAIVRGAEDLHALRDLFENDKARP